MTTQPEALRLAKQLDSIYSNGCASQAAAELRRLHEVNQMLVEAAEMALEALNRNDYLGWQTNIYVREALRQALEQPKQEPVSYQHTMDKCRLEIVPAKGTLLNTAPPKRE